MRVKKLVVSFLIFAMICMNAFAKRYEVATDHPYSISEDSGYMYCSYSYDISDSDEVYNFNKLLESFSLNLLYFNPDMQFTIARSDDGNFIIVVITKPKVVNEN